MPSYDKSSFHRVLALVAGVPSYLFGSWPMTTAPTRFLINTVQIAGNVATITGQIIEGNVPVVGALISIRGVQSDALVFDVTNVAISAVAINSSTGAGTIQFPLTSANFGPDSTPAAAGLAIIPQPETSEALANGASVACTLPVQDPKTDSARTVSVVIAFPSLPTTAQVDLQGAIYDQDAEYAKLGGVATVSGGAITAGPVAQFQLNQMRFYRLNVSSVTGGTNPTIIGKVIV